MVLREIQQAFGAHGLVLPIGLNNVGGCLDRDWAHAAWGMLSNHPGPVVTTVFGQCPVGLTPVAMVNLMKLRNIGPESNGPQGRWSHELG